MAAYSNSLLGPQIICSRISSVLFGLMTLQTHLYFRNFPKDVLRLKLLVAVVWTLKAVHWVLATISLYQLSVRDFGDPRKFDSLPTPLSMTFVLTACLCVLTQYFFCRRVHIISGTMSISALCAGLAATRTVLIFASCILVFMTPSLETFTNRYLWLLLLMFANGILVDGTIAASLTYFLSQRGDSETNTKKTRDLVQILMRWTIQTGTVTLMVTFSIVIFLIWFQETWIWVGLLNIAPGVWGNSLLASLNGRVALSSNNNGTNIPEHENLQFASNHLPARSSTLHFASNTTRSTTAGRSTIPQSDNMGVTPMAAVESLNALTS